MTYLLIGIYVKVCQHGTKLAPNLKPVHECTVIPQETCNLKFTPPRKEQKPLISEWCQDDSPPVPDQVRVTCGAAMLVNKYTWVIRVIPVFFCTFGFLYAPQSVARSGNRPTEYNKP